MRIELTNTPSADDAKFISNGLKNFNYKTAGNLDQDEEEIRFTVFARDGQGEIQGGLRATCFWNTLHVELIWVADENRGSGIGSEMLRKAEQYASSHGYEIALLETTTWQARPFYEQQGYELMGTLKGHPKGHATHFMTKKLT